MTAALRARPEGSAPSFGEVRDRIQADIFGGLPERLDRLRWDAARLRDWQRDRLRAPRWPSRPSTRWPGTRRPASCGG